MRDRRTVRGGRWRARARLQRHGLLWFAQHMFGRLQRWQQKWLFEQDVGERGHG